MKIIILGGNAAHNRLWTEGLSSYIAETTSYDVYAHSYQHWQTHAKFINIDHELQALVDSGVLTGDYSIIAKSMGSLLAMKGVYSGLLKPEVCLFLGFPLEIIRKTDLRTTAWIAKLQGNAQFIQNKHDPLGPYADVADYLMTAGVELHRIARWQGATHEYADNAAVTAALVSALRATNRGRR